jgi:hypothetical protein
MIQLKKKNLLGLVVLSLFYGFIGLFKVVHNTLEIPRLRSVTVRPNNFISLSFRKL